MLYYTRTNYPTCGGNGRFLPGLAKTAVMIVAMVRRESCILEGKGKVVVAETKGIFVKSFRPADENGINISSKKKEKKRGLSSICVTVTAHEKAGINCEVRRLGICTRNDFHVVSIFDDL